MVRHTETCKARRVEAESSTGAEGIPAVDPPGLRGTWESARRPIAVATTPRDQARFG